MDIIPDITSPHSGGATPRRIVKKLKQPLACVTQLVPLDNGDTSRPPHLLSRFPTQSLASEASISEVRSELCSVGLEVGNNGEASTSSVLDHQRRHRHGTRGGGNGNVSMSRSRASRNAANSRNAGGRSRRSFRSVSSREVDESFLSYSDEPVFYHCDSDGSTGSGGTEESNYSMSYTAISESVPSCSLTTVADPARSTGPGWTNRFRKSFAPPRHNSGSFGSIFGSGGIDPYSGTSVNGHGSFQGRSAGAGAHPSPPPAALNPGAVGRRGTQNSDIPQRPFQDSVVSLLSPKEFNRTMGPSSHLPGVATANEQQVSPSPTAPVPGAAPATAEEAENAAGVSESANRRLKVQRVKLLERVGRGTFGDVYRGEDLDTGTIIAVKEILVPHDFTKDVEKQLAALESEIRVMRRLHHPHVVTYLGANREANSLRIFMEFVGGGTVGSVLERDGAFSEERARRYTAQLLDGLVYLHDSHILHRDLKGDNLFLTEQDELKLGDFGQSKELADTLVTQSVQGTPSFMSPEMIACAGYSFEADVWSVGCCVIQMLTGKPPFSNLDNQMAVMFAIISSRIDDQIPAQASEGANNFIRMCTKSTIKDRWTAAQLRQHPWLLEPSATATSSSAKVTLTTTAAASSAAAAPSRPLNTTLGNSKATGATTTTTSSSNGNAQKPTRSILLDTAALERRGGPEEPRKASGDEHTPDNEADGNTSSNVSSAKIESSAQGHGAAEPAAHGRTSRSSAHSSNPGTGRNSRAVSPSKPKQSSAATARRNPRTRSGGRREGGDAATAAAGGQWPHPPPAPSQRDGSARTRASPLSGGRGGGGGGTTSATSGAAPAAASSRSHARGSAAAGGQTSRVTPSAAAMAAVTSNRVRAPASSRAPTASTKEAARRR